MLKITKIIGLAATMLMAFSSLAETPILFDPIPARPMSKEHKAAKPAQRKAKALATAESGENRFYANMWYTGDWDWNGAQYGIYSYPTTAGNYTSFPSVKLDSRLCGNAGAVYADGKYFIATAEEVNAPNGGYVVMSMHFYVFDTESWTCTEIADADEEFKAMDMAYDPASELIYGCFVRRGTQGYYYFGTFDMATGTVNMIRNYGQNSAYAFTGIAASDTGVLYGINAAGDLYTFDKATGATTLVGSTGLADQYMTSAAFDPQSGKIFYALNTDNLTGVYTIDPATAAAERVYAFLDEESLAGMYFPELPPSESAPAAPSAFSINFPQGALEGNVSFTAPTLTVGGAGLTGTLTYQVKANGIVKAQGTCAPGSMQTASFSVAEAGEYTITVACSSDAGIGAKQSQRLFIGHDTPLPVENVSLTYSEGGVFNLVWDAAKPAHGGYIDPAKLSYIITRYPDYVTATTSSTTFSETLPEPPSRTRYTYSVTATTGEYTTDAVESNYVIVGTYKAPCTMTFDEPEEVDDMTMIDGDNDGKTWVWNAGQLRSSICLFRNVNDYVVLPPVELQQGMGYQISIDVKATNSGIRIYPERVAVWVGTEPSLEALTTQVIAPTVVNYDTYRTISGDFTPQGEGPFYFAVQSCSDIDMYYLWVDNFTVSEPVAAIAPAPVSNFVATPGANGALSATLTYRMPAKDVSGAALSGNLKAEIYRDGTLLATRTGTPSRNMTFTDSDVANGEHTYGIIVASDKGRSFITEAKIYVGVHAPKPVTDIVALRQADGAEIALSWTPPATDTENITLPEGSVKYRIVRYDQNVTTVAEAAEGTSFVDRVSQATSAQEFVQYEITAINVAGEAEAEYSNITTYGRLIKAPAVESFAGGYADLEFVVERADDNASWTVTNPASNPGVEEYDADGGLLRFVGITTGDKASFVSGSFDVSALAHPALSFYYLYPRGTMQGISASVISQKNGALTTVTAEAVPVEGLEGWQRVIIPIEDAPECVQFILTGENFGEFATTIFIDNIRVADLPTPNITLNRFDVPGVVEANEPFTLTAYIENSGATEAEATVLLMLNSTEIASQTRSLAVGEHAKFVFEHTFGSVNPDELIFSAEASTTGDALASDNISIPVAVGVHHSAHPAPYAVEAKSSDAGALVRWNEPNLGSEVPETITEDVEGYVPFSIGLPTTTFATDYMGQWTSIDADGLYTLGVGHGFEAIPNATEPKAFMVFDGSAGNMTGEVWEAHSGSAMFVAFSALGDPGEHNDDWLISPLLPGTAQSINFYACSATDLYGLESMEILYSITGKEPADFTLLQADNEVSVYWTRYTAALPEGARYFAIRCTSEARFALCVDDITFTAAPLRATGIEVIGYNVYRNGERLNESPVTATEYTDNLISGDEKPEYVITAVYNFGESRPSAPARLDESGISDIYAPDNAPAIYYNMQGIPVENPSAGQALIELRSGKASKIIK